MWIQIHIFVTSLNQWRYRYAKPEPHAGDMASHRACYVSQLSFEVNKFTTIYIKAQLSSTAFPVMALECQYKETSYNNSYF